MMLPPYFLYESTEAMKEERLGNLRARQQKPYRFKNRISVRDWLLLKSGDFLITIGQNLKYQVYPHSVSGSKRRRLQLIIDD
jgi:hypothetical protein